MEKLRKHFKSVREPLSDILKMQLGDTVDERVRKAISNLDALDNYTMGVIAIKDFVSNVKMKELNQLHEEYMKAYVHLNSRIRELTKE